MTTISPKMPVIQINPTTPETAINDSDTKSLLETAQLDEETHGGADDLVSNIASNPTGINLHDLIARNDGEVDSPMKNLGDAGEVQATAEVAGKMASATWTGIKAISRFGGTALRAGFAVNGLKELDVAIQEIIKDPHNPQLQQKVLNKAVYVAATLMSITPIPQIRAAGTAIIISMEVYEALKAVGFKFERRYNKRKFKPGPGQLG